MLWVYCGAMQTDLVLHNHILVSSWDHTLPLLDATISSSICHRFFFIRISRHMWTCADSCSSIKWLYADEITQPLGLSAGRWHRKEVGKGNPIPWRREREERRETLWFVLYEHRFVNGSELCRRPWRRLRSKNSINLLCQRWTIQAQKPAGRRGSALLLV